MRFGRTRPGPPTPLPGSREAAIRGLAENMQGRLIEIPALAQNDLGLGREADSLRDSDDW
jgi:hypothetical protein